MKKMGIWFGLLCILQGVVPMQAVAESLAETKSSVSSQTKLTTAESIDSTSESFTGESSAENEIETSEIDTSSSKTEETNESSSTLIDEKTDSSTIQSAVVQSEEDFHKKAKLTRNNLLKAEYVTLTNKHSSLKIYQNLADLNTFTTPEAEWLNKTYRVTETANLNNQDYYLISDGRSNLGYVLVGDVIATSFSQGSEIPLEQKKYFVATEQKNALFSDFQSAPKSTQSILRRTLKATGYYMDFDGTCYITLVDQNNNKIGMVDQKVLKETTAGGIYQANRQYVTFVKLNSDIYNNFDCAFRSKTNSYYLKTYEAKGFYLHFNGKKYYTVYDNKGKWIGYVPEDTVKSGNGKGGIYQSSNRYITFTSANYAMYSNFDFKKLRTTKALYKRTYQARGYYEHFNGARYYTVYDNKGKWLGYVNAASAKTGNGKGGIYQKLGNDGVVISRNYATYNDFNFRKRGTTASVFNQNVQVRGYYQHFNGAKYYTLYTAKGKWIGYVNSAAIRIKKGVAAYLGTSRSRVLNHLTANEKNGFYVGTRYRGLGYGGISNQEVFMQPKGRPNQYGQGMNCTGFVAAAMRNSGANLAPITRLGYGGAANATLWRDALKKNSKYYTYGSINALLKSGRAKKGDILYLEGRWGEYGADCHIGIFWGNNGHQNRFWHQVLAGNMISNIFSGTPYSMIYLFPQE